MQPRLNELSPRPRRLAWGVAASLLVHAALIGVLGWQARPHRAPEAPSGRITWLTARLMPAGTPAAEAAPRKFARTSPAPRSQAPRHSSRAKPIARPIEAAAPKPAEAEAPPPAPVPQPTVTGVAFAPPRIGFGGTGTTRGMPPPSPTDAAAAPPQRVMPPPQMLAQAARQAGMQQIALALQQQLGTLPQPEGISGRCALQEQASDVELACDSASLQQALAEHLAALSGLLKAWRGLSPQPGPAAIAYAQGRYQLDLN